MKAIKQEDPYGCSVACVASVIGITHQEALKLFPNGRKKRIKLGFIAGRLLMRWKRRTLDINIGILKAELEIKYIRMGQLYFLKDPKDIPQVIIYVG